MNTHYALVTGASSGIGLQYARELASSGYNILVVSNMDEANRKVAAELTTEFKVDARPLFADLTRADSAEGLYDYCHAEGIEVEVLVSNAGILHFGKLAQTDAAAVDRIIALHCTTPVHLCRLFGRDMAQRHAGFILIMSSMTAWTPLPTMSLYGSTKAFLKNFSRSLWHEMRAEGVSVTTVYPSAVDTPFYKLEDSKRKTLRRLGMMISAEALAHKALRAMFRRRRIYTPGWCAKTQIFLCRLMPAHAYLPLLKIPAIRRILNKL